MSDDAGSRLVAHTHFEGQSGMIEKVLACFLGSFFGSRRKEEDVGRVTSPRRASSSEGTRILAIPESAPAQQVRARGGTGQSGASTRIAVGGTCQSGASPCHTATRIKTSSGGGPHRNASPRCAGTRVKGSPHRTASTCRTGDIGTRCEGKTHRDASTCGTGSRIQGSYHPGAGTRAGTEAPSKKGAYQTIPISSSSVASSASVASSSSPRHRARPRRRPRNWLVEHGCRARGAPVRVRRR